MSEAEYLSRVPQDRRTETLADVALGLRVKSSDYGTGTVVAVLGIGIQIHWDEPLIGTVDTHLLTHDKSFVARLERI
jgi:uncharacterized membrane protein YczE